jgi:amidohydrolase
MNKEQLKQSVCETIDVNRDKIIAIGEDIFKHPQLGYKEFYAAELVKKELEALDLKTEDGIAVSGVRARKETGKTGPTIAVMGELDAIICVEHEAADPETGAIHACGHHAQVAAMMGVAIGLIKSGAMDELAGQVEFMAVPAEEFVELAFRNDLRDEGKISYFGGKQELIKQGYLDDIDMAMMIHLLNLPDDKKVIIGGTGNGFIGKNVQFIGKEAHAGSAPEQGVNALNAAMIAINNIHVQRETFPDQERVRVHPIITKGGDIVNVVPADVRMETYVRARTIEGIKDANMKVNRSLIAGAYAVGANIKITEIPGYLPLLHTPGMDSLFKDNAKSVINEDEIVMGADFTGSFDFGDVSHLIPAMHPFVGGVVGNLHTREFAVVDPETAYILPAKLMAMTLIDLLFDGAKEANAIIEDFKPEMTKEEYLAFLESISGVIEK